MKKESGFSLLVLVLVMCLMGGIGFVGYRVVAGNESSNTESVGENSRSRQDNSAALDSASCDVPRISLPVQRERIESVLYPGQVRGNNFKPHGGFRLNGGNEAIVSMPLRAEVIAGVRYIEAGELQYMFDFQADCGYRFRLDHLHTLSPEMQSLASQLPEPTGDSRTTRISSGVFEEGAIVATKVGFETNKNSSFDFGLYDMNSANEASQKADWPQSFEYQTELATHAVCWFDFLASDEQVLIRSLPAADLVEGTNSVYCK